MALNALHLPDLLARIAAVAGPGAALAVAAAKGGTRAYFPRRPDAGHWLSEAVGIEAAVKIGAELATGRSGAELEVPMGPSASQAMRWRRILALRAAGHSKPYIARLTGCHYKTVARIANGKRKTVAAAVAQGDLFDAG